jgi:hypothetical protein
MWAARNCRFLSLSIRKYIESLSADTNGIKGIEAKLCCGKSKKLLELTAWELVNISNEDTMHLYDLAFQTLYKDHTEDPKNYSQYQDGVSKYSIGKVGLIDMYDWLSDIDHVHPQAEWKHHKIPRHKSFVSATAHYSLRKSASILGLGESSVEKVVVDLDSRVCVAALKKRLNDCLKEKVPVLVVVGIVGTTEESTVDNLA